MTEVKTFIDGMRSSRDTKMSDMGSVKAQLKDQNERLLKVTQEKAKMQAKNKARQQQVSDGSDFRNNRKPNRNRHKFSPSGTDPKCT